VAGLLALVGVGLIVGMVLGFGALAATRVLGLDQGAETSNATARRSMYLPRPAKTKVPKGPLITLEPGAGASGEATRKPAEKPTKSKAPRPKISLSAGETSVGAMEQIDLTGVYPRGEGAILQIQRFTAGSWQDFPVTASVSDETFSTYVQTSQPGVNRFRVVDTDSHLTSNEVRITVR
jgi:hypothetical protein